MWYETLPPLIIIATFMSIPYLISPYINLLCTGHKNLRNYRSTIDRIGYVRDYEQGGQQYWKFNGLEAIPDK